MKRIISLILTMFVVLILGACGETNTPSQEWPENEYTATIPTPNMAVNFTVFESGVFGAQLTAESIEEAKAYANSIINAGYSIDINEQDYDTWYSLYANNQDDYTISYYCNTVDNSVLVTISISRDNIISSSCDSESSIEESSQDESESDSFLSSSEEFVVSTTWPTTGLLSTMIKPSFGTLSSVSNGDGGQSAVFEGVDQLDFDTYLSDLIGENYEVVSLEDDSAELNSPDGSFVVVISLSNGYFTLLVSAN